jgi:hypothetical protein
MMAPAAILTRIGRVDFDSYSSSFCRFGEHLGKGLETDINAYLRGAFWQAKRLNLNRERKVSL